MMSSVFISNCINNDARVPTRNCYMNMYKLPNSNPEFANTVGGRGGGWKYQSLAVADSIPSRQVYLRSYSLSKKELVPERTKKGLERARESVISGGGRRRRRRRTKVIRGGRKRRWRYYVVVRRVKQLSCTALRAMFHMLLSCAVSVDVVDHKDKLEKSL